MTLYHSSLILIAGAERRHILWLLSLSDIALLHHGILNWLILVPLNTRYFEVLLDEAVIFKTTAPRVENPRLLPTMLLSVPVEDLLSSRLDIKLGDTASRLSCKFKPNVHHVRSALQGWAGITINIESVQGGNGCSLTLYASSDEAPSTSAAESPGLPPVRQDFSLGTMLPSMNMDQEAMSFLLSDTSPPQDYYSPFCSSASSSIMSSPPSHGDLHHDSSFDFASGCLSPDIGDHSDFDSQHFSQRAPS